MKLLVSLLVAFAFGTCTAQHEEVGHGHPVEVEHKRHDYRTVR